MTVHLSLVNVTWQPSSQIWPTDNNGGVWRSGSRCVCRATLDNPGKGNSPSWVDHMSVPPGCLTAIGCVVILLSWIWAFIGLKVDVLPVSKIPCMGTYEGGPIVKLCWFILCVAIGSPLGQVVLVVFRLLRLLRLLRLYPRLLPPRLRGGKKEVLPPLMSSTVASSWCPSALLLHVALV